MLKDNSLRVPSEFHLFKTVLQWIDHDKDDRLQYLAELMRNIRLPLLAGEELVEKVCFISLSFIKAFCWVFPITYSFL